MQNRRVVLVVVIVVGALAGLPACEGCTPGPPPGWSLLRDNAPGALLSVRATDGVVWSVGGDPDGVAGPQTASLLIDADPLDDVDFVAPETGLQGDLWWVEPTSATSALAGGSFGRVVRLERSGDDVTVTPLPTPAPADDADLIVFGVYAASADTVWAVGGRNGGTSGGFVWRSEGGGPFVELALPETGVERFALWKVHGTGVDDVWMVGTAGLAFHFDGEAITTIVTGQSTSLFTVDVDDAGALAVGGVGRGLAMVRGVDGDWTDVSPDGDETPPLLGVHRRQGRGCVVGNSGTIYDVDSSGAAPTFARATLPFAMFASLHACVVDDAGFTWAVGGRLTGLPLTGGVLLRHVP
jgi:hypothetical protein